MILLNNMIFLSLPNVDYWVQFTENELTERCEIDEQPCDSAHSKAIIFNEVSLPVSFGREHLK